MFRTLSSALLALACALALTLASPLAAHAADYPERPVHVLVGYAAGSGPDIQARLLSHALSESLHQSFVVENRTGANGTIAARGVAAAAPDGYTLLFSSSSITPTPHIYKRLGFDMLTDLKPVATSGELDGLFMLVDDKSPIKTLPEFIDYAKKNRVLYGSPGVGNELHLVAELFSQKAGIKMDHIPYKGASEVMNGLLSGAVNVMFVTPPSVMGLLRTAACARSPSPEQAVSGIPQRAADERHAARLHARLLGHVFRAGQDARRDRRQAQCGDPRRRSGARRSRARCSATVICPTTATRPRRRRSSARR